MTGVTYDAHDRAANEPEAEPRNHPSARKMLNPHSTKEGFRCKKRILTRISQFKKKKKIFVSQLKLSCLSSDPEPAGCPLA